MVDLNCLGFLLDVLSKSRVEPTECKPKHGPFIRYKGLCKRAREASMISHPSLRIRRQSRSILGVVMIAQKMLLVLTIALFVGLANSRPNNDAIGKSKCFKTE